MTAPVKVLLAEDELALAHIVRESLEERGFEVTLCPDGEAALQSYTQQRPHILVLDVMMPKLDGFALAKKIRETDEQTPIIFLTARSQPKDVVQGFELGANDYLKKPFSVEELIIRMKVLLSSNRMLSSKTVKPKTTVYTIGSIDFNADKHTLQYSLNTWRITSRESHILKLLYLHKEDILPRKELLDTVWGDDSFFNARSLDVFITKLRKHLLVDPAIQIINIRGVGYKLVW